MKWIKLAITILEYIIPALAKKGKNNLEKELAIAKETINVLSRGKSSVEKGHAVEEAIGNILMLPGVKASVVKSINKAKDRLYKKLF